MEKKVTVIDHPLVQHKLGLARNKDTGSGEFRQLLREIALLMAYEVTRSLPLVEVETETPLTACTTRQVEGSKIALVSILRAGNGLLDGILQLIPTAGVGFVGVCRDATTLEAHQYYYKMPPNLPSREVFVVDPMLATGHSAITALTRLKEDRPRRITFMCIVAAPEGIKAFHDAHPDVEIFTASIDDRLDEHSYIIPGLGDAGDRIYGTR